MGIIKKYPDGLVVPAGRYNQFMPKSIPSYELISKNMIGWTMVSGSYWVVYFEDEKYCKSFFAKNLAWFKALLSEPQFAVIGELPQLYII